jgi:DNA helicase II / ATP-dependent DNA helicase PcrA
MGRPLFELSEKKKEILAHDGHLLVHGGPGSGKTTISIIKADALVSGPLRHTQKVLFLSFARATVARVIEALAEHSANKPETRRRVDVDTYHAFFWRVLQTHGYLLGLPRRIEVLAPPARAVALSTIRQEFGPVRKLTDQQKTEKLAREEAELRRLAFEEGKICFDLFADLTAQILASTKIRQLISSAYPVIILDEFQDTNSGQWLVVQHLGKGSTLVALADAEQRIYDFAGADPERLNHFREHFKPKEFDLGNENHRSAGTDIARFGNDVLKGKFSGTYQGLSLQRYPANQNQAFVALKAETFQARKRLIEKKGKDWSLAILVPTKKLMRQVSDAFRSTQGSMVAIGHHAAIDMAGAILAAELIAFLMQPRNDTKHFEGFVELLCSFFRGKGGEDTSSSDISESIAIGKAFDKALASAAKGKEPPAASIIRTIRAGYDACALLKLTGNPDDDWVAIRAALEASGCKRLGAVAEEARNVRFLDRGTQLRDALSLDWRDHGSYPNALNIVRQAFIQEHFATSTRRESGVVVMNMHKAKGKQFDEVIIFEGWPRVAKGKIIANFDRIVQNNTADGNLAHARQNFRVSVTRARIQTTIMTPDSDPCVLLRNSG